MCHVKYWSRMLLLCASPHLQRCRLPAESCRLRHWAFSMVRQYPVREAIPFYLFDRSENGYQQEQRVHGCHDQEFSVCRSLDTPRD